MKKLRLLAVRDQKEELLKELIRHGCVEFSELEGELQGTELESALHRENPDLTALRARHTTLNHAIELLNVYAPKKSKLLSAKPELEPQVLLDDTGLTGALKTAEAIEGYDARIKRIAAEESRERSTIEALRPWQELDLPLDCEGTERCGVLLGTVPARMDLGQMNAALDAVDEESELFTIREEKKERYVLLVCMKDKLAAMQDALRPFGFTPSAVAGMSGTARECMLNAEQTLKELAAEKENCTRYIVDDAVHRDELKLAADRVSVQIALAEAEDRLCSTDKVLVMEGWIPAEKEKELGEVFDRFGCAWEAVDPAEDEYPRVPVQLKNNKFTNALNMVTNMYSLPAYGSRDPNPLMAPFFILFYGLMMADMGYGIIMIIAALVAMKKIKPRGGTLAFCQLLLYGGISTFVMGALTGGFFGNAPEIIAGMFGSTWKGLPYLFSPVRDSNMVLYGAMVLGLLHLNTGMAVNFQEKWRRGDKAGAIFEEGSQWVILVGGVLLGLQMLIFKDAAVLHTAGLAVIIAGVVMLLFGSTRGATGFGKITAPFSCLYNTLTGWFGDVLSYSRIMALMLAGGVVAQVFNTIAAMPSKNGVTPVSGLIFIVVFLIGHALNFALNLLGCFVHDLRLQCLEFFGKFYQDGGKPFMPLRIRTQYINPQE